jgi:hypothetical protein
LVNQEVLLPGHLWAMMVREQLAGWVKAVGATIRRELAKPSPPSVSDEKMLGAAIRRAGDAADPGKALSYFVATGNLRSESGLDLQQVMQGGGANRGSHAADDTRGGGGIGQQAIQEGGEGLRSGSRYKCLHCDGAATTAGM